MKRFMFMLMLLLLLTGCDRNGEQTLPSGDETTAATWPVSHGLYLPGSYLEIQTEGAVKLCPLEKGNYDALISVGQDLLLIKNGSSAQLQLLTDYDLRVAVKRELDCTLAPHTGLMQKAGGICAYYDEVDKAVVFLNAMLAETSRLKLPEETQGAAYLSPDLGYVYYCTSAGVHAMDMKSGVTRLLKAQPGRWQSVTGVLLEGQLLRVRLEEENGSERTCVLSAQTGETVWEGEYLAGLATEGTAYLMQVDSLSVSELVFGKSGEAPRNLWLEKTAYAWTLLPEGKLAVAVDEQWGSELKLFDAASGKCISSVQLAGIKGIYSLCADARGTVWMLGTDESAGQPVVCGWDPEKTALQDDTEYTQPHYTQTDYDKAGIAGCKDEAALLEQTYGVDILLADEAAAVKQGGYGFGCEYLVQAYDRYLPVLEQALAMFPRELYELTAAKTGSGMLHIGLVRAVYGSEEYGTLSRSSGVQFRQDGEIYLMLALDEELVQTFCRQLNLAMQSRILSESTAYYDWDKLNPSGFAYDNDYIANQNRKGDTYLYNDRAFIDTFSMSFATEDRATVFAYACLPGNRSCFQSETMQAKLAKLCDGIRQVYDLPEDSHIWEQYLMKALPE